MQENRLKFAVMHSLGTNRAHVVKLDISCQYEIMMIEYILKVNAL